MKGQFHPKRQKLLSCIICSIISLCVMLGQTASCFAVSDESITVKVGFFAFDGYHEQTENGYRSGYGYDILQHLAGYGGFRYEYVGYDKSWNEMQDMLERGEIDILTSAQKTDERELRFDFSDSDIGISAAILTTKAGDSNYLDSDFSNWNGIRVGMIEGNSRNDSFADFADEHDFSYVPVYFEDTEVMLTELQSDSEDKSIDAVITSNLRKTNNEWILAQFASSPFYVMVKKGNSELLSRINYAISALNTREPGISTELMDKYYATSSSGEIPFSPEERAYIESMNGKTLTALLSPDCEPYTWYENGAYHGILNDIAQLIISRTGLDIEFLPADNRTEYQQLINSGTAALRFDMDTQYNQAEAEQYWITSAYMTVPLNRLFKETTTEFHTVAIPINDSSDVNLGNLNEQGIKAVYYNSVDEAVQAVMDGKQDMAYLAEATATLAVRNDVTNRLVAEELYELNASFAISVNHNQNPVLYSILSKVSSTLTSKEIHYVLESYSAHLEKPFSFIGYCYDYPIHLVITVTIVLGIIILIIILASTTKRRKAALNYLQREQKQNVLLKDALDTAEKAGEAKSLFLSRVSHEMRTPLNAIIGFIELAKDTDIEQMNNYLASSDIAAKQLLNVINDVLDMSSIESGKLKIANAPFNFRHLISSITNIYGLQCKQRGIDFQTMIATPTDDWLVGDELRLNQILMNLLGNAVKFTEKGSIALKVSETASKENKSFMRFEISDSGCGMSEEMQKRLFKPFEQESATTASKYGGNGLGLSIVKNLVGMMNGRISVESKQGEGTTFIVDLPFGKSENRNVIASPEHVKSVRILAVDDESAERAYISSVLRRIGVRFSCVSSGNEAMAELERAEASAEPYNVCLIDWRMPEMNGAEITLKIREKYGKDVIVIVASAYDFHQANDSALKAGADLFISKPLFQSSLFDLLMTLTDGSLGDSIEEPKPLSFDFSDKRILLVEDNSLNQVVAKGFLAKTDIMIECAQNGQEAVDMFLAKTSGYYDAILMDIQMPVMDGFEATSAIRSSEHPQAKTIQIIAQTADAFDEDVTKALSCGMNAHISKPINRELLMNALDKAFSISSSKK